MRELSKMVVLLTYGDLFFFQLNFILVAQFSVVHFVNFKTIRIYSG